MDDDVTTICHENRLLDGAVPEKHIYLYTTFNISDKEMWGLHCDRLANVATGRSSHLCCTNPSNVKGHRPPGRPVQRRVGHLMIGSASQSHQYKGRILHLSRLGL
jgi:hypothetical protein